MRKAVVWLLSHRTTCDGPVHDYAIRREESWNKFRSCWVMFNPDDRAIPRVQAAIRSWPVRPATAGEFGVSTLGNGRPVDRSRVALAQPQEKRLCSCGQSRDRS